MTYYVIVFFYNFSISEKCNNIKFIDSNQTKLMTHVQFPAKNQ